VRASRHPANQAERFLEIKDLGYLVLAFLLAKFCQNWSRTVPVKARLLGWRLARHAEMTDEECKNFYLILPSWHLGQILYSRLPNFRKPKCIGP
jgi:hypothetical protein